MKLIVPLDISNAIVSQDYDEHVQRAKRNGWCHTPTPNCPSGIYYFGGIDWAYTANKTPNIWAAAPGNVDRIYNQTGGYGKAVRLKHDNGWVTIYAHLKEVLVNMGDRVAEKTIIGIGDNTGNSTGPHLHFELRNDRNHPMDPQPYLEAAEPTSFIIPDTWPEIPQVRITATPYLRIRPQPSTQGYWNPRDRLHQGTIVSVIEVIEVKPNTEIWLKIGHDQYCAAVWRGEVYAEWVS